MNSGFVTYRKSKGDSHPSVGDQVDDDDDDDDGEMEDL